MNAFTAGRARVFSKEVESLFRCETADAAFSPYMNSKMWYTFSAWKSTKEGWSPKKYFPPLCSIPFSNTSSQSERRLPKNAAPPSAPFLPLYASAQISARLRETVYAKGTLSASTPKPNSLPRYAKTLWESKWEIMILIWIINRCYRGRFDRRIRWVWETPYQGNSFLDILEMGYEYLCRSTIWIIEILWQTPRDFLWKQVQFW